MAIDDDYVTVQKVNSIVFASTANAVGTNRAYGLYRTIITITQLQPFRSQPGPNLHLPLSPRFR